MLKRIRLALLAGLSVSANLLRALSLKKGADTWAPITNLRPTQFAVGELEVERKQAKVAVMSKKKLAKYLKKKTAPVVIGPHGHLYLIDHHHTALALLRSGQELMLVRVMEDLSKLDDAAFWSELRRRKLLYLYDEEGRGPLDPNTLPTELTAMKDDPYRALAGRVRDAGDEEKSGAPYEEFARAKILRERRLLDGFIREKDPRKKRALLDAAVKKALKLS